MKFPAQLFILGFQSLYLHLKNSYLLVSIITDKLKIVYSVVVSNMVLMVNYLPRMKITPQVLSHYKAVFLNITLCISHWIKEVVWVNLYGKIATPIFCSSASPIVAVRSYSQPLKFGFLLWSLFSIIEFVRTMATSQILRLSFNRVNPPFLPTINTGVPNASTAKTITMGSYFSDFRHMFIITQQRRILKESI